VIFLTLILWISLALAEPSEGDSSQDAASEESSEAADEPSPSETPVPLPLTVDGDGEIIIYGERELARKRSALDRQLRAQGYSTVKKADGKTIYRPDIAWKPSVIVYDEGYMILRRTPVRFEPWVQGKKDNKLRYLSCIPPFTVLCVRSGWLVNGRKLAHSKEDIVSNSLPTFEAWQAQVIAQATENRIHNEIPQLLDELWLEGRSLLSKEVQLDSYDMRRAELVRFWENRACTPEGDRVRLSVEEYILFEVQNSEHPFPDLSLLSQEACGIKLTERLTEIAE